MRGIQTKAAFAGVALIAGGIGLLIMRTVRPAAICLGTAIFVWVWVLHLPRALAAVRDTNEWTSVFQALAMSETAFILGFEDVDQSNTAKVVVNYRSADADNASH